MAMNPMQRRARNSFLVGFLVAILIMAIVVALLLFKMKELNDKNAALVAAQSTVFVAKKDLKSGELLSWDDCFETKTVITSIDKGKILEEDDFKFKDSDGNIIEKVDENYMPIYKELMMKIEAPAGTIVTKNMVEEVDEQLQDSQRIQEFGMILLPSQLVNGDYIDIRLSLSSGQDYIVLSKKQVLGTTDTSVWLKLTEEELLIINNAIVESYTITGSKLYAIPYIEPGRQEDAVPTYTVSQAVLDLIHKDPNVTTEAWDALASRYSSENRINYFESALDEYREQQDSVVSGAQATEIENIKNARKAFIEALEGSEEIGYER